MADAFAGLSREERLHYTGLRLHELETRTPGAIDSDKLHRAEALFWKLIEGEVPESEWLDFCRAEKMHKYLRR